MTYQEKIQKNVELLVKVMLGDEYKTEKEMQEVMHMGKKKGGCK